MTKSELKPGYVVRYRNGNLRMVMPLHDGEYALVEMGARTPFFCSLEDFNENLTNKYSNGNIGIDIVEVYGFSNSKNSVWSFNEHKRKLLWKRPEKKYNICLTKGSSLQKV